MANYGTPLFEDSPPDYAQGDTPKAVMPEPEYTEPPVIETKTALESKVNWVQLVSIGFAFLACGSRNATTTNFFAFIAFD